MRIQPTSRPGSEVATVDEERYPVPDPGLEPHLPRLTDVDEKAADRATRQVATFFGLVPVLSIGFAVVYFAVPGDAYIDFGPLRANTRNLLLGLTFGLALLFLGVGAVQWARKLMDDSEMIDYRHGASSSDDDKTYMLTELGKAADEAKLTRRKIIGRTLIAAIATILLPMVVGLADLGPWPTKKKRAETIERTIWAPGVRVVNDVTFEPIKPENIEIGQLVNGEPANLQDLEGSEYQIEKAKAAVIVVRMDPNTITIPPSREDMANRRHLVLLQDLHPCWLPDQPVGAADAPSAVPLSPVHLRPRGRRTGGLRPGQAGTAAASDCTLMLRVTLSLSVTFSSRPAQASSSGTRAMISSEGDN